MADETIMVPLENIRVDGRLKYFERLVEILVKKVKILRNKGVPLVRFSGSIEKDMSELGSRSRRCTISNSGLFP